MRTPQSLSFTSDAYGYMLTYRGQPIGGAGIDVFPEEPAKENILFGMENVVATPHLGASTDEAQEKAGISVAKSVRLALSGELVPDAVNVQGACSPPA